MLRTASILLSRRFTLAFLIGAAALYADSTAVTITPSAVFPTGGFSHGTSYSALGWEFTPLQNISITALGAYDGGPGNVSDGFPDVIQVGIYDMSKTLLVSTTVPSGTTAPLEGGFRYQSIAPFALTAGVTYVISSTNPSGNPFTWAPPMGPAPFGLTGYGVNATVAGAIALGAPGTARYQDGPSNTLSFPNLAVGSLNPADVRNLNLGPSFKFESASASVPEPSAVVLLVGVLASASFLRQARRMQRN